MEALLLILFFVLLLTGMPIAFVLGITAMAMFHITGVAPVALVPEAMYASLDSFTLMAIPFFIIAANFLVGGKISSYLIDFANAYVGHITGGMGIVCVFSCMIFAALIGSSIATALSIGVIAIPAMVKLGYDKSFAMALTAAGGTLGILIPPSLPLIIYGVIAEESVADLFLAGVIPGVLLGFLLMALAVIIAKKRGFKKSAKAGWQERRSYTLKAIPVLLMPILVLGSIYGGVATPTECAAVAAVYALFIGLFVYRTMKWGQIIPLVVEGMKTTGMIMFIIATALTFGRLVTMLQIPQNLGALVVSYQLPPWAFLAIVNIVLIIMGCFLEVASIMLITLPIIIPLINILKINAIHFGIVMVVNMELALITPPVGLVLYAISGATKSPLSLIIKGIWPFIALFLVYLVLITYVPIISTWLPSILR
ncbi:MAG: TRAP transporter large permease subunit [Thermodesulfobacteriota bacterium]|nr:TRAP transporter large permease subunit [Thermodesulfobacteriota bacterium]